MPRSAGTYSLPAGNPVVTKTIISSTVHNNTMEDVAAEFNDLYKFSHNLQTISEDREFPAGYNVLSVGAITIADTVTVTVPNGVTWKII